MFNAWICFPSVWLHLLWCAWFSFGLLVTLIINHYCLSSMLKDNEGEAPSPPNNGKKGKSNMKLIVPFYILDIHFWCLWCVWIYFLKLNRYKYPSTILFYWNVCHLSQKFGFLGHVKILREKVLAKLPREKHNIDIFQFRNCFKTEWFKKYFKQTFKLEL